MAGLVVVLVGGLVVGPDCGDVGLPFAWCNKVVSCCVHGDTLIVLPRVDHGVAICEDTFFVSAGPWCREGICGLVAIEVKRLARCEG